MTPPKSAAAERQIRFNVSAGADLIQVGVYNGEEHLIVPCVALVGDVVVFGLHADFPELVPASELAFSVPSWAGRPVIPDHPEEGSANTPEWLDDYQYGQIFYPTFSDNRLRFDLWLSPARASSAGTSWVIEELEAGNMVEISIGASIELEPTSGTTVSGEYYGGIWRNISGDHIAVGLSGGRGACNLDMGCGALRFMSESEMLEAQNMKNENVRSMRRVAGATGSGNQNPIQIQGSSAAPAAPAIATPTPANEPPTSFLASLATRMGGLWNTARGLIEDVGQSDAEIRYALTDAVYHIEPGFGWIEEVFQESMTFIYSCFPWSAEEKWYRRTFTRTDSGVTISETREEVVNSGGWETVSDTSTDPEQTMVTVSTTVAASASQPCGCHNNNANATLQGEEENEMAKRDEILRRLAALSDDELEKLATPPAAAPGNNTATPETETTPATGTPTATPAPTTATVTTPAPVVSATPTPTADPATLAAAATAILGATGIDVAALNAMLAGEKARQDQTREMLITALSSRVPDLTREILAPQSTPQLEMMARAAGILSTSGTAGLGLPPGVVVDYSGLGLPVQPAALNSGKKYEAPDPFGLRSKKESAAN